MGKKRLKWVVTSVHSEYDVCLSMDEHLCQDYADIERYRWNCEKKYECKVKFKINEIFI